VEGRGNNARRGRGKKIMRVAGINKEEERE
jgi:hypothetical protein